VRPGAGAEQPHRGGLAVRTGHHRGRNVAQLAPGNIGNIRQGGELEVAPALTRAQCEQGVVQQVRESALVGRIHKRHEPGPRLARAEAFEACEGRGLIQHRRDDCGGVRGVLERRRGQRLLESAPVMRVACQESGAQCPLVDFRRDEQLIAGSGERERGAARMAARHHTPHAPPEVCAGPLGARAPGSEQRLIDGRFAGLEQRAAAGEEQVGARQTPR